MERLEQAAVKAAPASACADLYPEAHAVLWVLSQKMAKDGWTKYATSDVVDRTVFTQGQVRNIVADLFDEDYLHATEDARWQVRCPCRCIVATPRVVATGKVATAKLERVSDLTQLSCYLLGYTVAATTAGSPPPAGASSPLTASVKDHGSAPPFGGRVPSQKSVTRENSRSLAQYFLERLVEMGGIAGGNTNVKALAGTMARLRRDGVGLDQIRTTVDVFFDVHPEWTRDPRPAWKLYIANIKRLLQEAERKKKAPDHLHRRVGSARTDYLVGLTPQERTQAQLKKFLGERYVPREERANAAVL